MNTSNLNKTALIIGGGFFGCRLSLYLKKFYKNVIICEMADNLFTRATYNNQARVHNGYHYPRSLLTALRCHVNFPKFIAEYPDCIESSFNKYYAIGKRFSKVSAKQFRVFIDRVGSPIKKAPEHIKSLFNERLIEEVFLVDEVAFDALKLKKTIYKQLIENDIDLQLNTYVNKLTPVTDGRIIVHANSSIKPDEKISWEADKVFNCTYTHINQILDDSKLPKINLKHELTEMALIQLPEELKGISVTMMCGPFFSFLPFPPKDDLYTLSHVRYTPHHYWYDSNEKDYYDGYRHIDTIEKKSNFVPMIKDAQRYIPLMRKSEYVDSIWEVKTVLPRSERNDSRPILLKENYPISNLTCIMGGKIDNIYDAIKELSLEKDDN